MNESSASLLDKEAEASRLPAIVIDPLQKAADYLETRYNLWKRRSVPFYNASPAEIKVLEKAAKYCVNHAFAPATYFQSQVDELEGIEAIANYSIKSFIGEESIERAHRYRTAREIRDQAQQRQAGKVLIAR